MIHKQEGSHLQNVYSLIIYQIKGFVSSVFKNAGKLWYTLGIIVMEIALFSK